MRFDLISIGCISLDTYFQVPSLPKANSESFVKHKYDAHGGGAANVAAYAAFYGDLKVGLVSKIGTDKEGEELVARMKEYGVSVEGVSKADNCSSTRIAVIHDSSQNQIYLVHLGAVEELTVDDMPSEYVTNATIFYIAPAPPKVHKEFVELGVDHRKLIAFNPGTIYFQEGSKSDLNRLLVSVDFLFVDEREALEYANAESAQDAGAALQKRGAKHVIITRGPVGCMLFSDVGSESYRSHEVKRVSPAGAGDVFAAGFLAGIVKQGDLESAVTFGNALAAFALTRPLIREAAPNITRFLDFL